MDVGIQLEHEETTIETLPVVDLYVDGVCKGNPGLGGWGAVLRYYDAQGRCHDKELCGGEVYTTSNRIKLMAVVEGLKALRRPCFVRVYTNSQYVQKGISEWMENWRQNNWLINGEPIKNHDLWQAIETEVARHQVQCFWIKKHSGYLESERADALANEGARLQESVPIMGNKECFGKNTCKQSQLPLFETMDLPMPSRNG